MTDTILCVDDDPNILAAFRRKLRGTFHLETALGPEEGLAAIEQTGPYAVVVTDLRMPGMDGIQFLARARAMAPDTVRVMLTGYADLEAAIAVVNQGHIFRFLTKPVRTETLVAALQASLDQYRLITTERDLLAKTLYGGVKVLTNVLSLVNPTAFSQTDRLKRYVGHMARELDLPNPWQFELAAMLSQIGCVTLPPELLEKVRAGQPLTEDEREMYVSHPQVTHRLLLDIPRLELVAEMIARQNAPFQPCDSMEPATDTEVVALGAELLKVALDFDRIIARGMPPKAAIKQLRRLAGRYHPAILDALERLEIAPADTELRAVDVRHLRTGMILAQDVQATNQVLLVAKGQEVTLPVLERLRRFAEGIGIVEPIRVRVCRAAPPVEKPQAVGSGT